MYVVHHEVGAYIDIYIYIYIFGLIGHKAQLWKTMKLGLQINRELKKNRYSLIDKFPKKLGKLISN